MRYIKTLLASSRRKLKEIATMASSSGAGSHLERTADASRLEMVSPASVVSLRQESPSVRGITLKLKQPKLEFKAGQWMDVFIPGVDPVGGFSLCSSPSRLIQEGVVDLAVKQSSHPPADWMYNKCSIGSEIFVRIGGDFFFDPNARTPPTDLLLIAGGIGVNPLFSIFQHVAYLKKIEYEQAAEDAPDAPTALYSPGRTLMLYSAITDEELLFKTHLDKLCKENEEMKVKYFVTKNPSTVKGVSYGRIGYAEVCTALQSLNPDLSLVYICGPASMIESMENYLLQYGVDTSRIFFERWW